MNVTLELYCWISMGQAEFTGTQDLNFCQIGFSSILDYQKLLFLLLLKRCPVFSKFVRNYPQTKSHKSYHMDFWKHSSILAN